MKTLEELKKEGWEFITNFGNAWVMGKGDERILWNPKTGEITLSYIHNKEYGFYTDKVNKSLGLY